MDMTILTEELESKVTTAVKPKIADAIVFNRDYEQYPPSGIYNYFVDTNVVKMKAASNKELSIMIEATIDVLKKHGYTIQIEKEENSATRYFSRANIYFE